MPRKRSTPPKPNGRPPADLDKIQFETMCGIWCTQAEICAIFRVDDMTLNAWCKRTYGVPFSEIYPTLSRTGDVSLRRAQYKSAIEKGDWQAQKWLGIQRLGQTNKVEHKVESDVTISHADIMDEIRAKRKGMKETP